MKKTFALLLTICLLFGITACGLSSTSDYTDSTQAQTSNDLTNNDTNTPDIPDQEPSSKAHEHNWAAATCTEPERCTGCGATRGSAKGHNFQNGKCTRCGAPDPSYTEIIKILTDIERYPKYLELDAQIIENLVDCIEISGKAADVEHLLDVVTKDLDYIKRIAEETEDCQPLYPLYQSCRSVDLPSSSSINSFIRGCKSFARSIDHLSMEYKIICESYGISVD